MKQKYSCYENFLSKTALWPEKENKNNKSNN